MIGVIQTIYWWWVIAVAIAFTPITYFILFFSISFILFGSEAKKEKRIDDEMREAMPPIKQWILISAMEWKQRLRRCECNLFNEVRHAGAKQRKQINWRMKFIDDCSRGRHCVNSNYFIHYISFHNLNYTAFAAIASLIPFQFNCLRALAAAIKWMELEKSECWLS